MATRFTASDTAAPPGTFKRVEFPQLAMMDTWTEEGPFQRRLESAGGGTRSLPRTIFAQFRNDGHDGAEIVGPLTEVTLNDDGRVSGAGFLLDDANGHRLAYLHQARALQHNSVDLVEVDYFANVDFQFDKDFVDEDGKEWFAPVAVNLSFNKWKIGSTTFVALPAFADAHGELPDDEITAALMENLDAPLVWDGPTILNVPYVDLSQITASVVPLPSWDDFHRPEPDTFQPFTLDEHGVLTGHLGLWNSCHDGIMDRCVRIPTPHDNYASFNNPGVLTDKGMVETGPITLLGGHARNMDEMRRLLTEASNNVENAWADVRVVPGRFGPWCSGRVRPHITDAEQYMARASRVSGWWVDGRLKGICSVNIRGYDVPGSDIAASLFMGSFNDDGEMVELVAGGAPCEPVKAKVEPLATVVGERFDIVDWSKITKNLAVVNPVGSYTTTVTTTNEAELAIAVEDPDDATAGDAEALALLIALDEDEQR